MRGQSCSLFPELPHSSPRTITSPQQLDTAKKHQTKGHWQAGCGPSINRQIWHHKNFGVPEQAGPSLSGAFSSCWWSQTKSPQLQEFIKKFICPDVLSEELLLQHLWIISGHSHSTAPQRAPGEAHWELQTPFPLSGVWWVPEEHPGDKKQGTHGWKHPNVGGHDFTSCILQSLVFYCNYVLATNYTRGKWLRVLLSLRIQHKSHRAAVAEMMKYLYCCFSITGVS